MNRKTRKKTEKTKEVIHLEQANHPENLKAADKTEAPKVLEMPEAPEINIRRKKEERKERMNLNDYKQHGNVRNQ